MWSRTQVLSGARTGVWETPGMPTTKVRMIVPDLGGGCGD
ncbi:MAG: hypothetical protein ACKVK3_09700 [Acidimicrobiales bacterium]